MSRPTDLFSQAPFRSKALEYFDRGFFPIPLPEKKKFPPPTGTTGGLEAAKPVTQNMVESWVDDKAHKNGNIGVTLRGMKVVIEGDVFQVLGVDVDNYAKGTTQKLGAEQLERLEERLGDLPDTWISTSRTDGKSGIRWFLVPNGLHWSGKAANDIDIVSHHYRFAVVWPSVHDEGGVYYWYEPGAVPDGDVGGYAGVPHPSDFAMLPERWVKFLTKGGTKWQGHQLDLTTKWKDVQKWVEHTFARGGEPDGSKWCRETKERYEYWTKKVEEDPSSHDKLLAAQWQFARMGLTEGHKGVGGPEGALEKFTRYWYENVMAAEKRGISEASAEMERSISYAYRKIKWEADELLKNSDARFPTNCTCFESDEQAAEALGIEIDEEIPLAPHEAKQVHKYEISDLGNAQHLRDLFTHELKWLAQEKEWIFWDGQRWDKSASWGARCLQRVKVRLKLAAEAYAAEAKTVLMRNGNDPSDEEHERSILFAKALRKANVKLGSYASTMAAQNQFKSLKDCTIDALTVSFNQNPSLLGVANGLIELSEAGFKLRNCERDDFVSMNTGIPYIPFMEQLQSGGELALGAELWMEFLEKFQPDPSVRAFLQKLMGYALYGRNDKKLFVILNGETNTGKSTFLNMATLALGEYAGPADISMFKSDVKLNPVLHKAMPRRLVTFSEIGNVRISAETVKQITGGEPKSVEIKGSNVIAEAEPCFLPMVGTNSEPNLVGVDRAYLERMMVIPFDHQEASSDPQNVRRQDQMYRFSPVAMLAWMIEGWAKLQSEGGLAREKWPMAVRDLTSKFEKNIDPVAMFIDQCLEEVRDNNGNLDEDVTLVVSSAFKEYCYWAEEEEKLQDNHRLSAGGFGKRMSGFGHRSKVKKEGGSAKRVYVGLRFSEGHGSRRSGVK